MIRPNRLSLLLLLCLAACQPIALSPPPSPAPASIAPGAIVRIDKISLDHPTPPLGFGLYLYVLPERRASATMLRALMKFQECLHRPGPGDQWRRVALMLMPVRQSDGGDQLDIGLAHDFLHALPIVESSSGNQVWIVATNTPLRLDAPALNPTPISLGRIAPAYISDWLFRFQDNIEQGTVAAPSDWLPRVMSAGLILVTVGHEFLGVPAANAAAGSCSI